MTTAPPQILAQVVGEIDADPARLAGGVGHLERRVGEFHADNQGLGGLDGFGGDDRRADSDPGGERRAGEREQGKAGFHGASPLTGR